MTDTILELKSTLQVNTSCKGTVKATLSTSFSPLRKSAETKLSSNSQKDGTPFYFSDRAGSRSCFNMQLPVASWGKRCCCFTSKALHVEGSRKGKSGDAFSLANVWRRQNVSHLGTQHNWWTTQGGNWSQWANVLWNIPLPSCYHSILPQWTVPWLLQLIPLPLQIHACT